MAGLENVLAAALSGDPVTAIVAVVLASLVFVYAIAVRILRIVERLIVKERN